MFAGPCIAGTAATSGRAGWGRGSWSRRSSFAGSRDTNRFRRSSKNWKLWRHLSRGLSNGERRRRVGYAGTATFNGVPGILWSLPVSSLIAVEDLPRLAKFGHTAASLPGANPPPPQKIDGVQSMRWFPRPKNEWHWAANLRGGWLPPPVRREGGSGPIANRPQVANLP